MTNYQTILDAKENNRKDFQLEQTGTCTTIFEERIDQSSSKLMKSSKVFQLQKFANLRRLWYEHQSGPGLVMWADQGGPMIVPV